MVTINLSDITPGTVLGHRYQVVRSLGKGTSGEVFQCTDTLFAHRNVAVKLFAPGVAYDKTVQARIHRELRSIFRVRHDHVVAFYDFVNHDTLYGFSMEYAGGGTLERFRLEDRGGDLGTVVHYLIQACGGLHAIHQRGLIHRDLKPANLLLSEDLCAVKISDFGLARELDSTHGDKGMGAVTLRGQIIGTPRYLSPEYVDQGITDVRSDIYALGLVGYELIAGLPAYSGNSVAQVLIEKLKSEPRPLHQVAPNCPPELSGVIHKAIALDPAERFSTAEEFKIALQRVAAILEARGPHRYPGATLASFLSSIPVGVRKFVVATLVGGVYLLLFAGLLWRLR